MTRYEVECHVCNKEVELLMHADFCPPLQNCVFDAESDARAFHTSNIVFGWCGCCQHISIDKNVANEFTPQYDNRQSFSPVSVAQLSDIVENITASVPDRDASIVEIGCGHGDLLHMLADRGYSHIKGYDPAAPNSSAIIQNTLWRPTNHPQLLDCIIIRHALEEVSDPDSFMSMVVNSLKIGGKAYVEITNAAALLNPNGVYSMYPEYHNLFSSLSLGKLFARNGLAIQKITSINHGEWLGILGVKIEASELAVGTWGERVRRGICNLPRPIVLWGTGGRGGNILAFLKLDKDVIEDVIDISPARAGKFIPPYGQRISGPDSLSKINPASIIVANQKYRDEITRVAPPNAKIVTISDLIKS